MVKGRQIIGEANIAKRSLYKHFASKTDLLLAYLDEWEENWYKAVRPFLAKVGDPRERLLALFDFRIIYQKKHLFPGCPFIKINAEAGFDQETINRRVRRNKDGFRAFIQELAGAAGPAAKLSADELGDLVYLLIEGAVVNASIYKSTVQLKKAKQLVGKLF